MPFSRRLTFRLPIETQVDPEMTLTLGWPWLVDDIDVGIQVAKLAFSIVWPWPWPNGLGSQTWWTIIQNKISMLTVIAGADWLTHTPWKHYLPACVIWGKSTSDVYSFSNTLGELISCYLIWRVWKIPKLHFESLNYGFIQNSEIIMYRSEVDSTPVNCFCNLLW